MSVHPSIGYMDFTMNVSNIIYWHEIGSTIILNVNFLIRSFKANVDTILNYGKLSPIVSIVCLLLQSWMRKSFAVMED